MTLLMINISYNFIDIQVLPGNNINTAQTMDLSEEQKLVEEAKNNSQAFAELYDLYFPKVYAFVAAKIKSRDDAEDITGDIFVKILENLQSYEWRGLPFGAWVFRIARNALNDYYNKSGRTSTADIEELKMIKDDEEKTSPHKQAAQEELATAVKKVLGDLPERDLSVIQLKFFGQLTNREIVHVTGISESNVAVIIYRTLRRIKPDIKYFV